MTKEDFDKFKEEINTRLDSFEKAVKKDVSSSIGTLKLFILILSLIIGGAGILVIKNSVNIAVINKDMAADRKDLAISLELMSLQLDTYTAIVNKDNPALKEACLKFDIFKSRLKMAKYPPDQLRGNEIK
jgi:hypothetical protein